MVKIFSKIEDIIGAMAKGYGDIPRKKLAIYKSKNCFKKWDSLEDDECIGII